MKVKEGSRNLILSMNKEEAWGIYNAYLTDIQSESSCSKPNHELFTKMIVSIMNFGNPKMK